MLCVVLYSLGSSVHILYFRYLDINWFMDYYINTPCPFPQVNFRSGDVCPAGYYCPEGTRHPHQYPCPLGTWSNVVGAQNVSSCSLCPSGFFCNRTGLTQPTGPCAAGHLQWRFIGIKLVLMRRILVDLNSFFFTCAGFFCIVGAKTSMPEDGATGNRCPSGFYCPQGCTSPQHCPDGMYSNTTGKVRLTLFMTVI